MERLSAVQALIASECDRIKDMLIAKNRSYGNSALEPVRVFSKASSVEQILVRIDDKLSRIARGKEFGDEDVVFDLIGYLVLLRVQMRSTRGEQAQEVEQDVPVEQEKPLPKTSLKKTSALRSLLDLQAEAFATAMEKGWWDKQRARGGVDHASVVLTIPEKLALVHSEVSEALEDYRVGSLETKLDDKHKPVGFPTELADIIIRVLDLSGALGIDIQAEVEKKLEYNKRRNYRHGGKKC